MITLNPHNPNNTFDIALSPSDTGHDGTYKTDYPYLIMNALKKKGYTNVSVGAYTWEATNADGVKMHGIIPMQMQWKDEVEMGWVRQSPLALLTLHKQKLPVTIPLQITHLYN